MPVYVFHTNGQLDVWETEGHLISDDAAARVEALRTFGQILEFDVDFVKSGRFSLSVYQGSRLVMELVATVSPTRPER